MIVKALHWKQQSEVEAEVARLLGYGMPLSFDLETTGFDPRKEKLVLVTFKAPGARTLLIDARDADQSALRRTIAPLFGGDVELWGHNLQFDMYWMREFGIESSAFLSDTMLRELLILGVGFSEGGKRVDLKSTGERYGIAVSKEERMWFPGLDKRLEWKDEASGAIIMQCTLEEDPIRRKEYKLKHYSELPGNETLEEMLAHGWTRPWLEPIPQEQLQYARQDVAVVIRVHDAQDASIKEQHLRQVDELESRVLPAVVGMRHYGVGVDRGVFERVLSTVHVQSESLAQQLHEVLDVPIMQAREQEWKQKMAPYQQWAARHTDYMAQVKQGFDDLATEVYTKKNGQQARKAAKQYSGPGWGVVKKEAEARFKEQHPEPSHPAALKAGVNLSSPVQIVQGLRGIGLIVGSADQKALAPFAGNADLIGRTVQLYLDFSDYKTVEKRWGNGWMDSHLVPEEHIDHTTGEVATEYRWYVDWQQIGAGTGRFSSGFQQVNKKGPGAGLRKAFVPRTGYKLVVADFSNIELRIAAALSGAESLLKAFSSGLDLHTYTAEIMFQLNANAEYLAAKQAGKAKEWADTTEIVINGRPVVNTHYRDSSKTINFMVLYQGGVRKLASELHVGEQLARQLKRLHYNEFHDVLDWIEVQGRMATGYEARTTGRFASKTRSGRRRWFTLPVLAVTKESTAQEVREAKETYTAKLAEIRRSAANAPVQGTSADITKLAIALWHENYESEEMHLVFTLHDEIALEVVDEEAKLVVARNGLRWCMMEAMRAYIPEVEPGEIEPVIASHWRH